MAELADAHGSGPCGSNTMRVQVSFPARKEVLAIRLLFFARISIDCFCAKEQKNANYHILCSFHFGWKIPIIEAGKPDRRRKI